MLLHVSTTKLSFFLAGNSFSFEVSSMNGEFFVSDLTASHAKVLSTEPVQSKDAPPHVESVGFATHTPTFATVDSVRIISLDRDLVGNCELGSCVFYYGSLLSFLEFGELLPN